MKKALIIISIVLVVGLAVWFFGFYLPKKKKNTTTEETLNQVNAASELPAGTFPLKPGDKNKKVLLIQKILNLRFNAGLTEDGIYGPKTQEAVAKFITQEKLGAVLYNAVSSVLSGATSTTEAQILDLFKTVS